MKRSENNKDEDSWKEINSLIKHVTGNKTSSSQIRKRWFISIIATLCTALLLASIFWIGLAMQNAFNTNMYQFKEDLPEERVVVDMNKVDIHVSDTCLRLTYFKEKTIDQVFVIATKIWWWKDFLSTDKNKYDFTFYNKNTINKIDNSLVQNDGFVQFDLKIKLKNLPFQFQLPLVVQITNTAKFYEKFMMFNHFESSYQKHIDGYNPPTNPINSERRYHGYLNHSYHFLKGSNVDNTYIYQELNKQITDFETDYSNEFAANTKIYPIITTIDLGDLDFNDKTTFLPFLNLIYNPQTTYVGNATIGAANEYVNLLNYTISDPVSGNLKPFYIFYISNHNLVNDLILHPITTQDEIITYFKNNPIDYLPFSHTQAGLNNADNFINYSPIHFLTFQTLTKVYFQYWELDFFLANVQSIKNDIENIRSGDFATVGDLTIFLSNKFWEAIRQFLINNSNYFSLIYPDPLDKNRNWNDATNSVIGLKNYFINILGISLDQLTSIQYLDEKHDILALDAHKPINWEKIKNFKFNIGPEVIPFTTKINPPPHSLTYFFKTNWT